MAPAMTTLITGAAGFIGSQLARRLLARGDHIVGIDNLNDYYDVRLKRDRLADIASARFTFLPVDFADAKALDAALGTASFDRIVHLGAQPGVRYSLENPRAYAESNLVGHLNMLEIARHRGCGHFVYASSSSVYGGNESLPFRVEDRVDHPFSLYAATKKADELMSETYAHLYRLPATGLRFFTVYGPWGRPDMAVWLFTRAILAGEPIAVYNGGDMRRDFTFIDDIIRGVVAAHDNPPSDDGEVKPGGSRAPHRLYNIGNNRAEELGTLIALIEQACGREAIRDYKPMQPGDVPATYADIEATRRDLGFAPTTPIEVGVPRFVEWYKAYQARR
jgi:UDP-glucuronate 4-epimerase